MPPASGTLRVVDAARVVDVALDPRNGGAEAVYTYRDDADVRVGDAVFVPLGNRAALGFVVAKYEATAEDLGFPLDGLKPINGRVEGLSLPEAVVDLARTVAEETLCPLPVALTAATPPGIRDRLVTAWTLEEGVVPEQPSLVTAGKTKARPVDVPKTLVGHQLTPLQQEVVRVLHEAGGSLVEAKGKKLQPQFVRALRLLRSKGLVRYALKVLPYGERRQTEPLLRLIGDEARIESFLHKEGRRRPAQALTLIRLQAAEQALLTMAEIRALAAVTETTVKALLDAGLLERVDAEAPRAGKTPTPNLAQQLAIDAVSESVRTCEFQPFLLYGVTGSGKTEVYLRAAAEALKEGRQVLFLVPEIALAAQAIAQLRERFGRTVAVLHSDLPAAERLKNWLRIRDGEASVVLGARSALFAPLTNVGLIVVDEEHENAYKQESAPRYHTKRVALWLAERHRCPVVFGSATPSIESFYEAETAEAGGGSHLTLLTLPERAAAATLPAVHIEDLTEGYRGGKPSILTEALHGRMEATLGRGEQVILFLNRRAYAPFVICRDCGNQMECPNCAVSLSYHRRDQKLRCHHCGYQTRPPEICPNCKGMRLAPFGIGTEKVEEAVAAEFPEANVARLDRDVARRQGVLEDTLARFRSGDLNVLVGTQMVAKGLDFPNVTLVGVIAADVSLNIPDFRSSERTFQLLSQVAGRAGRGRRPGEVVIQTFNPFHPAVQAAQAHDYLSIYETLRREREEAGYPPFRRLVNVIVSGESHRAVLDASAEAARRLAPLPFDLLGPVDCAVERVQNRWRRHMLLKLPPEGDVRPVGEALLGFEPKGVQVVVDVDPYNLM